MADVPESGFQKYWTQKPGLLKSGCHAIMNKYTEADSVAQQVHKILRHWESCQMHTGKNGGKF
jgi:hypothetical protein